MIAERRTTRSRRIGCSSGRPVCLSLWGSGVRQALKRAAGAEEVGGSSIEASKIAAHSTVRMTEEYTKIQLTRQEELTRLIQERLASVGEKQPAVVH